MAAAGGILQERVVTLLDITARIPGGIAGLTVATDDDVIDLIESAQLVLQSAQGIFAAAAGELDRRSSGSGQQSLARRLGWKTARGVIAAKAGISFGEASRAVSVGEAIRPRVAKSGEDLPPDRPHLAQAVLAGELTISIADVIDRTIEKVAKRLDRDLLVHLEANLVAEFCSGRYSVADFITHCHQVVELLDPVSAKDRDAALRRKASITETWLPNGMLRIVADLDPEAAAFYRTAMRARTNPRRNGTTTGHSATSEPDTTGEPGATTGQGTLGNQDALGDPESAGEQGAAGEQGPTAGGATVSDIGARRTAKQPTVMESRVLAFIGVMRDAVKVDNGKQAGIDTTILVRIDFDALMSGLGSATIDGIAKPISAVTARRLAAEADLIPQVLNGKSQVLDQGESKRVFTKAQRYAILASFVGCAFPKCDIPSSMLEFHHIGRWAGRHEHECGTDLENGLPLCGFHNRLMEDGWDIRFDDDRIPWFLPPATLDPARTPIQGGNLAGRCAA